MRTLQWLKVRCHVSPSDGRHGPVLVDVEMGSFVRRVPTGWRTRPLAGQFQNYTQSIEDFMNADRRDKTFKVVFLGEAGVGKTSIVCATQGADILPNRLSTIVANTTTKAYQFGDERVELYFWDTGGHERYRTLVPMYLRNVKAAVVVYAINSGESFSTLDYWLDLIHQNCGSEQPYILLIGNKVDLTDNRVVSEVEALEYVESHRVDRFVEISAKNDKEAIEKLFYEVAFTLHKLCVVFPLLETSRIETRIVEDVRSESRCPC